MFKNLDKKLLHHYPLLWNTKFPYIILIGIVFNILAYFGAFIFSDFSSIKKDDYGNEDENITIVFGIIGLIILLFWFLFYIRNNGFKVFYPKSKNALFKEWILIFCAMFLFSLAYFSVHEGIKNKALSTYTSLAESKKLETVFKAGFFINYPVEMQIDSATFNPVDSSYQFKKYITYKGRTYPWQSVIAKYNPGVFDEKTDSIYTVQFRDMLFNNDSVAVKKLMQDYLNILKENNLKTNLSQKRWYAAAYRPPYFESYRAINITAPDDDLYVINLNYGRENSELYMQHYDLNNFYSRIIYKKGKTEFGYDYLLMIFYFSLAISLLVFVFRISNILHWFLGLLVIVIFMIINVMVFQSFLQNESLKYLAILYCILAELIICVLSAFIFKKNNQISAVFLNAFVLAFGFVVPLFFEVYRLFFKAHNDQTLFFLKIFDKASDGDSFFLDILVINVPLVFLGMFLLSRYIRNRKALPE